MKKFIGLIAVCMSLAAAGASPSVAADDISFAGKTITMTVGNPAGSGIDLYGRLLGRTLAKHLPGQPNLVVMNQPGAGGLIAFNNWANRAPRDGLSVAVGGLTELDPANLLSANAEYDPKTFRYVGGLAAPSQGLFINKDALPRLRDKSAAPVVMGAVSSAIRGGYYQTLWGVAFLGWNVKWVPAYQGTSELRRALEQGEADMSSFGNVRDISNLNKSGKFAVVSQTGGVKDGKANPRDGLQNAPIFADLVRGHIKDPLAQRAYSYGENVSQIGRWLALPPDTPDAIVAVYLKAYEATLRDPEFTASIEKTDPGSPLVSSKDLERIARDLAKVSPEVVNFIKEEQRRQGYIVE